MTYFLISSLLLMVSTFLFKRAAGSLSMLRPNMISFIYYWQVLTVTFIGALLVILNLDNHYVISRVSDDARLYGWAAVMYVMVAVPFGMLIAKRIWLGRKKVSFILNEYVEKKIDTFGSNGAPLKYTVWVFTAISMFACLYTFYTVRYFPFLKALTASGETLDVLRISSSRDFQGVVYIRNILAISLMPLLSYVWAFYYIAKRRLLDGLMFVFSFIMAASILYYDFSKSPLLWYVLSYIFVYYYALGRVRVGFFVGLGGIAFVGLVAMYSIRGVGLTDFISYNTGPVGRIILGQAAGTYYMFDIFPYKYNFIGFSSLSQYVSGFFGVEHLDRAARFAMVDFNPKGVEAGTAGVMNSLFVAEAWANFGWVGVVVSPIWVGFLIGSLYYFLLKKRKSPLWLALFVVFSFGEAFTGGFNEYIYNAGFLVLIALVIAMLLSASILRTFKI